MLAYQDIERQKSKLSPEASTMVDKLPERSIREIRQNVPEHLKASVYEIAGKINAESKTPFQDIKQLVKEIKAIKVKAPKDGIVEVIGMNKKKRAFCYLAPSIRKRSLEKRYY